MKKKYMTLIELTITLAILVAIASFSIHYALDHFNSTQDELMRYEMKLISNVILGKNQPDGVSAFVADLGAYPDKFEDLVMNSSLSPYPTPNQWSGPYLFLKPQYEYLFSQTSDTFAVYLKEDPKKRIDFLKPKANLLIDFMVEDATLGTLSMRKPIEKQPINGITWDFANYNVNDSCMAQNALFKCIAVDYKVDSTATILPPFIAEFGRTFDDGRHLWQCVRPLPCEVNNMATFTLFPRYSIVKQTHQQALIHGVDVGILLLEVNFDQQLYSDPHVIRLRPGMNYVQIPVRKRGM